MSRKNSRRNSGRREVRPEGVASRIGDAPPSHYVHRPAAPPATYRDDAGAEHRTDGSCHTECRDWR